MSYQDDEEVKIGEFGDEEEDTDDAEDDLGAALLDDPLLEDELLVDDELLDEDGIGAEGGFAGIDGSSTDY